MLTKLLEINQIDNERAGVLDIPEKYWPAPGQYMPCQRDADPAAPLVTNLFRVIGTDDRLYLGPLPEDWLPGDSIRMLPPQGNGFSIPAAARRVGLLPFDVSPLRLLPLLKIALMQNAALGRTTRPRHPASLASRGGGCPHRIPGRKSRLVGLFSR